MKAWIWIVGIVILLIILYVLYSQKKKAVNSFTTAVPDRANIATARCGTGYQTKGLSDGSVLCTNDQTGDQCAIIGYPNIKRCESSSNPVPQVAACLSDPQVQQLIAAYPSLPSFMKPAAKQTLLQKCPAAATKI